MKHFPLTIRPCCGLMAHIPYKRHGWKICPCGALLRAGGWWKPVQSLGMIWFLSRPCETAVMGHGGSRYRAGLCWKSVRDLPLGDNQGGTANVNSSLRSCDLRAFFFTHQNLQISVCRSVSKHIVGAICDRPSEKTHYQQVFVGGRSQIAPTVSPQGVR